MSAGSTVILPGGTLGVLGGGQLGRMFVHAAQAMGFRTIVLDPDPSSPAGLVAHEHLCAPYSDPQALATLAERADAVTTEFENVDAEALRWLATASPSPRAPRPCSPARTARARRRPSRPAAFRRRRTR